MEDQFVSTPLASHSPYLCRREGGHSICLAYEHSTAYGPLLVIDGSWTGHSWPFWPQHLFKHSMTS